MRPRPVRAAARRALGRIRWLLLGSLTSIGMIRCPPDSREQAQRWLAQFHPDAVLMPVEDPFLVEAREGIAELERYLARVAGERNA